MSFYHTKPYHTTFVESQQVVSRIRNARRPTRDKTCETVLDLENIPVISQAPVIAYIRAPKDHINMRVLQSMMSGISPTLGLGTKM